MPVTYADVWEFWLRYREIAERGRFHHHPHPAVLGGLPDPGARCRAPRRRDPQAGRRRLSGQGDLPRRIRLAERGPHARGRAAVAGKPGPYDAGGVGDSQARELPRQPDRGLRPALEAPARRHCRRPLGAVRRLPAQGQIHLGCRGLQPSALALAGGRRRRPRGAGVRRWPRRLPAASSAAGTGLGRHCRECNGRRVS